jgi:hypothetical protein
MSHDHEMHGTGGLKFLSGTPSWVKSSDRVATWNVELCAVNSELKNYSSTYVFEILILFQYCSIQMKSCWPNSRHCERG